MIQEIYMNWMDGTGSSHHTTQQQGTHTHTNKYHTVHGHLYTWLGIQER